jgi:hypothetical protein
MSFSLPYPLRRAAIPLALLCFSAAASAGSATGWNEAVNGDFSGDGLAPTFVSLGLGSNLIRGTTGRAVTAGPVDRDYFSITVPAGHVLTSMEVLPGTVALFDGSFIGLMSGSAFTVPPTTSDATGLLGWTLFSENDVGEDLLPKMATPFFGSSGFTTPLPAGSYAFWVQETGVGTASYGFSLTVTAVPEPATALSLLGGLALLSAALKRRSGAAEPSLSHP